MSLAREELSEIATEILAHKFTPALGARVCTAIDNGDTSRLVAELIRSERTDLPSKEEVATKAAEALELFAWTEEVPACALMARLQSIACDFLDHQEYDGMTVFIGHCDSPDLLRYLKDATSAEADPKVREHYEELIGWKADRLKK